MSVFLPIVISKGTLPFTDTSSLRPFKKLLYIPSITAAHDNSSTVKGLSSRWSRPNPGITRKLHPQRTKHKSSEPHLSICSLRVGSFKETHLSGMSQCFNLSTLQLRQQRYTHTYLSFCKILIAYRRVTASHLYFYTADLLPTCTQCPRHDQLQTCQSL